MKTENNFASIQTLAFKLMRRIGPLTVLLLGRPGWQGELVVGTVSKDVNAEVCSCPESCDVVLTTAVGLAMRNDPGNVFRLETHVAFEDARLEKIIIEALLFCTIFKHSFDNSIQKSYASIDGSPVRPERVV